MSPVHVGLDLGLRVTGEPVRIVIPDTDDVLYGRKEFALAIPSGGLVLQLSDVLAVMANEFKFDVTQLPAPVKNLATNSSIILNELKFKRPEWQYNSATKKVEEPSKDKATEYSVSLTLKFSKGEHGGLLTDLLGVEMTSILDIEFVTLTLMTDFYAIKQGSSSTPKPPAGDNRTGGTGQDGGGTTTTTTGGQSGGQSVS
jgi:hypothetical protein